MEGQLQTEIQISSYQVFTADEVRGLDVKARKCRFHDESNLTITRDITITSCYMECRLRYLSKSCRCTPYFYPRVGTKECVESDFVCLQDFSTPTKKYKPPDRTPGFNMSQPMIDCDCITECESTVYNFESTTTNRDHRFVKRSWVSYVDIHYSQTTGVCYRKELLFGLTDLIGPRHTMKLHTPRKVRAIPPPRHRVAEWRKESLEFKNTSDCWTVIKSYFKYTTLHGFRYITAEGLAPLHRVFWILICSLGVAGASTMIISIWSEYVNSPTVTVVEDKNYPLYKIPFPAVTVCNVNKVVRSKAENFVKQYDSSYSDTYMATVAALGFMGYPAYHLPAVFLRRHFNGSLQNITMPLLPKVNITDLMLQVMPDCSDIFLKCFWKGQAEDCCSIFHLQRTEEGFCYSFNSRTAEDFRKRKDIKVPKLERNNAAGATTGLEVFFNNQSSQYMPGDYRLKGVNVHVHHPDSFPDVAKGLFIPEGPRRVMMAQVSPSLTYSTEEVRSVWLEKRRCFFPDEMHLRTSYVYTRNSCYMECRMHFLENNCKCTPYFFPNHDVRVCGPEDFECLFNQNAATRNNKPPPNIPGFNETDDVLDCHCFAPCTEIHYSIETTYIQTSNFESEDSYGYIDVFFKEMDGVRYRNDVMFGWMELMVSFGGIAGLFMGFSLISAAELVYWLIVRFVGMGRCGIPRFQVRHRFSRMMRSCLPRSTRMYGKRWSSVNNRGMWNAERKPSERTINIEL